MLDTANPTSVRPRSAIRGAAAATRPRAVSRIGLGRRRRPRHRVRPGGPAEIVEPQPQHHRSAGAARLAHPPGDPVDEVDDDGVDLGRRHRVARPTRAPAAHRPSDAARRSPPGVDRCCGTTQTADGPSPRRPSTPTLTRRVRRRRRPSRCRARAASRPSSRRHPTAGAPAADAETPVHGPAVPAAGRRAWPPGWRPWPGTWCARCRR